MTKNQTTVIPVRSPLGGISRTNMGDGFLYPMNIDEWIKESLEFNIAIDPENCSHTNLSLRKQRHGAVVKQCQDCGRNCSNAISQQGMSFSEKASILPYDYDLEERGWARREEERKLEKAYGTGFKVSRHAMTQKEEYQEYLRSAAWKAKRQLVIDRENNLCQGCKESSIDEVHHATYCNAGNELLFQLIGLCWKCHRRAHPEKQ